MIPFIQTWFMLGLLHPFQTPSHLILMVSLGFLIGQNTATIKLLALFLGSTVLGIIINQNLSLSSDWNIELILLSTALIISLFVAIRFRKISFIFLVLCSILSGFILGYDSSPTMVPGLGSNSIYNWIFGAVLSIIGGSIFFFTLAVLLRQFRDGIILRIIGSWLAASSLFTLTLSFAKL